MSIKEQKNIAMNKRDDFIWNLIKTACWLIFAGLCIQTGALVFNFVYSLFRPVATSNLHLGLNLSDLYQQRIEVYVGLFSLVVAVSWIKAVVFYHVLRLFKKLKLNKPFTEEISKVVSTITYYAFTVGWLSYLAHHIAKYLAKKNYAIGVVERYWDDSGAYLMMSAVLFVFAFLFKKGMELQTENDLTV